MMVFHPRNLGLIFLVSEEKSWTGMWLISGISQENLQNIKKQLFWNKIKGETIDKKNISDNIQQNIPDMLRGVKNESPQEKVNPTVCFLLLLQANKIHTLGYWFHKIWDPLILEEHLKFRKNNDYCVRHHLCGFHGRSSFGASQTREETLLA